MRWMLRAKSRSSSPPGEAARRNSIWSYTRSAWKCSSIRMRQSRRSSENCAPSRPYSRTPARKWPRAVASRTVFSCRMRSTSAGGVMTAAMSGDGEHLDVAQCRHRIGREVLLGELRLGHQRIAQLVGEDLVLEVHRRVEPVLRDGVDDCEARGELAAVARSDRLQRIDRLVAIERIAGIELAAEVAHFPPRIAVAMALREAAGELGVFAG